MLMSCPPHCLNIKLSALLEYLGPSIATTVPDLWHGNFSVAAVAMRISRVRLQNAGSIGRWHIPSGCPGSPS